MLSGAVRDVDGSYDSALDGPDESLSLLVRISFHGKGRMKVVPGDRARSDGGVESECREGTLVRATFQKLSFLSKRL